MWISWRAALDWGHSRGGQEGYTSESEANRAAIAARLAPEQRVVDREDRRGRRPVARDRFLAEWPNAVV